MNVKHAPAPQRSKITGMRALSFGDLWFLDHVDISVDQHIYCVLIMVDAATNFIDILFRLYLLVPYHY